MRKWLIFIDGIPLSPPSDFQHIINLNNHPTTDVISEKFFLQLANFTTPRAPYKKSGCVEFNRLNLIDAEVFNRGHTYFYSYM